VTIVNRKARSGERASFVRSTDEDIVAHARESSCDDRSSL
jgi:hypothetical protein